MFLPVIRLLRSTISVLVLMAACLMIEGSARGDAALIVGIDNYKNALQLRACAQDARQMETVLSQRGFKCTLLLDSAATHDGIMAWFHDHSHEGIIVGSQKNDHQQPQAKADLASGQRFVFYFAGRGTLTKAGDYALLPYDAGPESKVGMRAEILGSDLHSAMLKMHARSRTIILDTGLGLHDADQTVDVPKASLSSRYARLDESSDCPAIPPVLGSRLNDAGICYVLACGVNETAYALPTANPEYGAFTRRLCAALNDNSDATWSPIMSGIRQAVSEDTGDQQHPFCSPGFQETVPFEPQVVSSIRKFDHCLADIFDLNPSSSSLLSITLIPAKTRFATDETAYVRVKIPKQTGTKTPVYLLVINHEPDDRFSILAPDPLSSAPVQFDDKGVKELTAKTTVFPVLGSHHATAVLLFDESDMNAALELSRETDSFKELKSRASKIALHGHLPIVSEVAWTVVQPADTYITISAPPVHGVADNKKPKKLVGGAKSQKLSAVRAKHPTSKTTRTHH